MRVTEARDDHDDAAFSALLERHRRELQVHCYRMLGSSEDAEDLVQAVMPPLPTWWEGRDAIVAAMARGPFQPEFGRLRLVPIRANRQPAAACYLRRPGDSEFRPLGIDVLRIEDGRVVEMTSFACRPLGPRFSDDEVPDLFPAFGLAPAL